MDFHGDINLLNNELQQSVVELETDFPVSPAVGRVVFTDKKIYLCVALNESTPIWIPLTNIVNYYVHDQSVSSATWTVTHNLNSTSPAVKVYDSSDSEIIPESIVATSNLVTTITFDTAITGKASILFGDLIPTDGIGILLPERYAFTQDFTSLATIVVQHNLGYYPIIRVYVAGDEVEPSSVVHDSIFQSTVTLSGSQTGTIRAV